MPVQKLKIKKKEFWVKRVLLLKPENASWIIAQQIAVKGLLSLKFLFAARFLGPEQIGLVGIATLALAITESLSETGMLHAIVQKKNSLSEKEAGAAWTFQIVRGLLISIFLVGASGEIASLLNSPQAVYLIALAGALPLLRNSINPGLYIRTRNRDFRAISIYELFAAISDFGITVLMMHLHVGPASLLIGSIAGDTLKLVLSWTWLRIKTIPSFNWNSIAALMSFGKWIWGSSILTTLLNQADKIIIAKIFGTTELGIYQTSSRIAQLLISDASNAYGQYLYPSFSKRFRESEISATEYLIKVGKLWFIAMVFISTGAFAYSEVLINLILGDQWQKAAPIFRLIIIPMFIGSQLAILVPYFRAIGNPQIITKSMVAQLLFFIISAAILIEYLAITGVIIASTVGGVVVLTILLRFLWCNRKLKPHAY